MERELRVRFRGDAEDLRRAARDAGMALQVVEREANQAGRASEGLARKIGELAAAYVTLSGAAAVAQKGFSGLAQMEQAELGFKVLFDSAEKAKAKMQELTQFAASTPFQLPQVVEAAKLLETFGLNSSKYLRDAGDLASAFNTEISEVARVMGRINAGDFGEAFERLRDFGIARKDLEGEGLVFDKSGSYQGSVDAALTAVQAIIREKFGGMMQEQSQTFTGQMSTLGDNAQAILNKAFAAPFDVVKERVGEINQSLDNDLGTRLNDLATLFGDNMYNSLLGILPVAEGFGGILLAAAEKTNQILGGVGAIAAKAGAETARRDMMKAGISGIQGLNPVQRIALQATSHHSLDDLLLTSQAVGVSEQGKGQLIQLYTRTKAQAEKAADDQFIESYQSRVGAIKSTLSPRTTKTTGGTTGGATGGNGAATRIEKAVTSWVSDMVNESASLLELSLDQYLTSAKSGLGLSSTGLSALSKPRFASGIPSTLGSSPLPSFTGLVNPGADPDFEKAQRLLEQWNNESQRGVAKHQEWLNGLPKRVETEADKALRSGLEAGAAAFLDGGLAGLGETTYTVSKQALSKALVDAVIGNDDLKSAFGQLGAAIGHPLTAAVAAAALGLWEIKKAFDQIERHNQKLEGYRSRYFGMPFGNSGSMEDLRTLTKERAAYAKDDPWWLLGAGIANDAKRGKLSQYDALIPTVAGKAFSENWDSGLALKAKTLEGALTTTHAAVLQFADANGLSAEVTNQLVGAKLEEIQATYKAAKALSDLQAENSSLSGLLKGFDWKERLGGGSMTAADVRMAGISATGGKLDIGNIDQGEAIRLAELYGLLQYGGSEGAPQYGIGGQPVKSTRQQAIDIIGYDPGRDSNGNDLLKPLLDQMVLPLLAEMRKLSGGNLSQAQPIGSLSNPDTALMFDAPQMRSSTYNQTVTVNTYAVTGDKASFRALVREIMAEANTMAGQSV